MSLSGWADLEEDNDRLRDQLAEAEEENTELEVVIRQLKAEINELKAQLNAKEEGARQIESRDGLVWTRTHGTVA